MKQILTILLLLTGVSCFSQSRIYKYNKKRFSEDNYFYVFDNQGGTGNQSTLKIVKPSRSFWGSLKEDGNIIIVKPDSRDIAVNGPVNWITVEAIQHSKHPTGNQLNYVDVRYFPEVFYPTILIDDQALTNSKYVYRKLKRVKYRDYKFVLQGISIPLKFRKALGILPYQTETGVNIGFGTGLKWSYNWYAANKTFLGQKTNSLSLTPGALLGFGATDIKANITASPLFKDRKEPIFSYGLFFMVGFNNINVGFIMGKDVALKDGGKAGGWVYNGKSWTGIAVALDIIK